MKYVFILLKCLILETLHLEDVEETNNNRTLNQMEQEGIQTASSSNITHKKRGYAIMNPSSAPKKKTNFYSYSFFFGTHIRF